MNAIAAAVIVAVAVWWAIDRVRAELQDARNDAVRTRALAVMQTFAAGVAAAREDPRQLLTWCPLARAARQLLPAEFALLDSASGGPFPFSNEQIQAAHAEWTSAWLAWERMHDAEYKLKAAMLEADLSSPGASSLTRAKLDAVEREKLDLYQRHYQDYVRVAKSLQALLN